MNSSALAFPTIEAIRANRARLGDLVVTTPVRRLVDDAVAEAVGKHTDLWLKEELFQRTGSFKPRGALSVMLDLDADALARGVTGVSAGNHAVSLGYSSRILGTTAKVVMPRTANAFRVQLCRELGVEIELVDNVTEAFDRVREIESAEHRTFVHPYEGPKTALGTATVGMEFIDQVRGHGEELDAVLVAAGGGGLTGGVACAVKQMSPSTSVYVIEPEGADTMYRSFKEGSPQSLDKVRTIADSLGAPRCEPYSFALNREFVDEVVLVDDEQIRNAMRLLFRSAKLVVEPAGAAALAALMYPLRERLDGRSVGVVVCGGNIDAESFSKQILA
jgi:threonine dehydratase